jgi:hypothetical protein
MEISIGVIRGINDTIRPHLESPFGLADWERVLTDVEDDLLTFVRSAPGSILSAPTPDDPIYRARLLRQGVGLGELEEESRDYHAARRALCARLRDYLEAVGPDADSTSAP